MKEGAVELSKSQFVILKRGQNIKYVNIKYVRFTFTENGECYEVNNSNRNN